ncbi:methylthioribulose-1-phosphate dehydratase [Onishia taeanensis]|uniref:Methylthioribulose-1-phosphate dehydratase n=1 Tax=Onishia taeanensis TaxID=284577 RepID=A0A1G7PC03_9GAMM|nr:methylthioribulose 1-phosphate dehydratase [Halomonas taeanensis]MAX31488.1 methylthioribulose-1-phosphate dehydratase [Halomonadaceae bacterium]SDF83637.1 methylthioribulose-1-phosphate dehydratase [Halomonas taeanensis]
MIDLEQLARAQQAIVAAGDELYRAGQVPATGGNFSVRLDATHMAVTASGRHKGRLTPADVMVTDFAVTPLGSPQKPSDEARLHGQLYQDRPEAGAVLHTHSRAATVLSRLIEGDTLWLEGFELQKAIEGVASHDTALAVPIVDNDQDIAALAEVARERLRGLDTRAYLIRGHGLYTWARDMSGCLRQVEALDFLFDCELIMRRTR